VPDPTTVSFVFGIRDALKKNEILLRLLHLHDVEYLVIIDNLEGEVLLAELTL